MLKVWDCDDADQLAALLTTELVTNAVRHAAKAVRVDVALYGTTLWVGASDDHPGVPVVRPMAPESEDGRGMFLIEQLADAVGDRTAGGPEEGNMVRGAGAAPQPIQQRDALTWGGVV